MKGTKGKVDALVPSVVEKAVNASVSENILSNMEEEETVVQYEESEETPGVEVAALWDMKNTKYMVDINELREESLNIEYESAECGSQSDVKDTCDIG